jgi:uncharacterized membrane protein
MGCSLLTWVNLCHSMDQTKTTLRPETWRTRNLGLGLFAPWLFFVSIVDEVLLVLILIFIVIGNSLPMFNLEDEDEDGMQLTHMGQSLSFDGPNQDDFEAGDFFHDLGLGLFAPWLFFVSIVDEVLLVLILIFIVIGVNLCHSMDQTKTTLRPETWRTRNPTRKCHGNGSEFPMTMKIRIRTRRTSSTMETKNSQGAKRPPASKSSWFGPSNDKD